MKQKDSNYKRSKQKVSAVKPAVKDSSPKPVTEELKGLCVNCENRFTCLMSNQPGGVWYCEEYE